MADLREMRIFSADQIEVPDDLPGILKDYSKEVTFAFSVVFIEFCNISESNLLMLV